MVKIQSLKAKGWKLGTYMWYTYKITDVDVANQLINANEKCTYL